MLDRFWTFVSCRNPRTSSFAANPQQILDAKQKLIISHRETSMASAVFALLRFCCKLAPTNTLPFSIFGSLHFSDPTSRQIVLCFCVSCDTHNCDELAYTHYTTSRNFLWCCVLCRNIVQPEWQSIFNWLCKTNFARFSQREALDFALFIATCPAPTIPAKSRQILDATQSYAFLQGCS